MTERPQNVRSARNADLTHNSHRYQPPGPDRGDGGQTTTALRAYRGSHRAERMHSTDGHGGAYHRSSRVGRHYLDRSEQKDHQRRW